MWAVGFCELVRDNLGAIWRSVVHNNQLPVEFPMAIQSA
jgi:hypothetical protein